MPDRTGEDESEDSFHLNVQLVVLDEIGERDTWSLRGESFRESFMTSYSQLTIPNNQMQPGGETLAKQPTEISMTNDFQVVWRLVCATLSAQSRLVCAIYRLAVVGEAAGF